MSPWLQVGVAVAALLLVVWVGWRAWRGSRRGELRRLAPSLGIAAAEPPAVETTGWLADPAGGRGSWPGGSVDNVWSGEVLESRFLLFELAPPSGSADPVALFEVTGLDVPAFDLSPRDGDQRLAAGEVSVPAGERFGELYRLECEDPSIVERLFRREVRGFFERAENLDWRVSSNGAWLGITTWPLGERDRKLAAKHLAAFLEDARLVFRVLLGEKPRPRIGASR